MLWTLCLTDSYVDSIKLSELNSTRNLYELLDHISSHPNLVLADDSSFKNLNKLKEKLYNENINPIYQNELISIFAELFKQSFLEKDNATKNKFFKICLTNSEDYEFIDELSINKLTDAAIINSKNNYLNDLKKSDFEIIEEDENTGIKFSKLIKTSKEYHSKGIPSGKDSNIKEMSRIFLDSKEINFIAYNFMEKMNDYFKKLDEEMVEPSYIPQMLGTIYFLTELILKNNLKYNIDTNDLNIFAPISGDRSIDITNFILKLKNTIIPENSEPAKIIKKFKSAGNSLNIYLIDRKDREIKEALHTRGIFTNYCNISTERDELCWHSGSQMTGKNNALKLSYSTSTNMDINLINKVKENKEITKKIKIF